MKKLFIDIDDVVCNSILLDTINEVTGKNYSEDDFSNFYMQENIPKDLIGAFYEKLLSRNLYANCVIKDDCKEVIKKLSNVYDVYFLTSAYVPGAEKRAGRFYKDKYDFVVKYFPFIEEKKLIISHNKSIINGDILIDDRIENLTDNFKTKLLFTAYSNKNIPDEELKKKNILRFNNWKDIEHFLTQHNK